MKRDTLKITICDIDLRETPRWFHGDIVFRRPARIVVDRYRLRRIGGLHKLRMNLVQGFPRLRADVDVVTRIQSPPKKRGLGTSKRSPPAAARSAQPGSGDNGAQGDHMAHRVARILGEPSSQFARFRDACQSGIYQPREFILENLTLERAAQNYLGHINRAQAH